MNNEIVSDIIIKFKMLEKSMREFSLLTLCFLMSFCVTCYSQPRDEECTNGDGDGINYFALVTSIHSNTFSVLCEGADKEIQGDLGLYGASHIFYNSVNGVKFLTNITIDPSSDFSSGYFNFMEMSQNNIIVPLPSMQNMILNASIVSDTFSNLSLVVNYKNGDNQSFVSIPLDDSLLDFELEISWLNSGCINSDFKCNNLYGQIQVKIKNDTTEIVRLHGIAPQNANIILYLKTSSVFWGEIDSQNYSGGISLSMPGQNNSL